MTKKTNEQNGSPFKTVIQNLAFHNFEEVPDFVGLYKDTVTLGDEEDPDKTFTANIFVDMATGEEVYVTNSYSIAKAIKNAKLEFKELMSEVVFQINYLGKTTVKGKPFNQYKIGVCELQAYEEYTKKK
jgi:hypothetical protein